jgi:hypothetical protein
MRLTWISYAAIPLFSAMATLVFIIPTMFPDSFFNISLNMFLLAIPVVLLLLVALGVCLNRLAKSGKGEALPWWVHFATVCFAMLFLFLLAYDSVYYRFQFRLLPMDALMGLQFALFFMIPFSFIAGLALELFKYSWKGRRIRLMPGLILLVLFAAISITYGMFSHPGDNSMNLLLAFFAPATIMEALVISRAGKDNIRFVYYLIGAGTLAMFAASSVFLLTFKPLMIDYKWLAVSLFLMITLFTVGTDLRMGMIEKSVLKDKASQKKQV